MARSIQFTQFQKISKNGLSVNNPISPDQSHEGVLEAFAGNRQGAGPFNGRIS
jgi:hypothetical protein